MRPFDCVVNGDAAPFELDGGGRFTLSRQDFVPAYVKAFEEGGLHERAQQAIEALRLCRVCPRDCEIEPLQQQDRRLQEWPACVRRQRVPAFRRGRLSARVERIGHNLFRLVQSALCFLPKF